MHMKLLLKNNLTLLHSIDLKGAGGTGLLEVVKVLKKSPFSGGNADNLVNAHTL